MGFPAQVFPLAPPLPPLFPITSPVLPHDPHLDGRPPPGDIFPMYYLALTVVTICLIVALLALARVITNWFADR